MTASPRTAKKRLLVVDDMDVNLRLLSVSLSDLGYEIRTARSGSEALELARQHPPDLVLLDICMPGMDGYDVCRALKADRRTRAAPVIFLSALTEPLDKVTAFDAGGVDYVMKPFDADEVKARVRTHLELRALQEEVERANVELEERVRERTAEVERLRRQLEIENEYLREEVREAHAFGDLVGESAAIESVRASIRDVAPTAAPVLVLGESGTGKELVAREIHRLSGRADAAMIRVNCASVPRELFESEFFGHVRGAFSGAIRDRVGRFEAADGGTLFLDELGEIPLDLQSKLLRVLQDGIFQRVGEEKNRHVDVRIVAATNRDLEGAIEAGTFREDLYYRLNVFPITIPPLRERGDDVVLLADHFLATSRYVRQPLAMTAAQRAALTAYPFPGNVRELQNLMDRAAITARDGILSLALPNRQAIESHTPSSRTAAEEHAREAEPILTYDELRERERDNVARALRAAGGRIAGAGGAAERLGVPATTLRSRMKAMGLDPNST